MFTQGNRHKKAPYLKYIVTDHQSHLNTSCVEIISAIWVWLVWLDLIFWLLMQQWVLSQLFFSLAFSMHLVIQTLLKSTQVCSSFRRFILIFVFFKHIVAIFIFDNNNFAVLDFSVSYNQPDCGAVFFLDKKNKLFHFRDNKKYKLSL